MYAHISQLQIDPILPPESWISLISWSWIAKIWPKLSQLTDDINEMNILCKLTLRFLKKKKKQQQQKL